jgi:hypothetical protein
VGRKPPETRPPNAFAKIPLLRARGFSGLRAPLRAAAVTGGGIVSPFLRGSPPDRPAAPSGGDMVPDSRSSRAGYSANGADMSPPAAWRRVFSCLACTDRKWAASSCHLMSPWATLDRVAATLGRGLRADERSVSGAPVDDRLRFGRYVEEAGRVYGTQTVAKRDKRGALREQHQQAVQALEEVRVSVRFQELEAEV